MIFAAGVETASAVNWLLETVAAATVLALGCEVRATATDVLSASSATVLALGCEVRATVIDALPVSSLVDVERVLFKDNVTFNDPLA